MKTSEPSGECLGARCTVHLQGAVNVRAPSDRPGTTRGPNGPGMHHPGKLSRAFPGRRSKHQDRVVPGSFPQVAIQTAKKLNDIVAPRSTEIVSDVPKRFEGGR
jgi:hypothetical protein